MKRARQLVVLATFAVIGCGTSSQPNPAAPVHTVSHDSPSGTFNDPVAPATEPFLGYSLIAPLRSAETYLVDMNKQVVHQWSAQNAPGSAVYLLENGDLLRGARDPNHSHFRGGGIGARVQRFDWEGNLVWDFNYANESHCLHHDIEPMPNGNVLMIAWELISKEEAIAQGRDPDLLSDDGLWPDHIIEVKPTGPTEGEIVWQWHMWDHLVQDFDREKPNYGVIYEHPELIDLNNTGSTPPETPEELRRLRSLGYTGGGEDSTEQRNGRNRRARADWLHTNAIHYNSELDQIALSAKNFSEIWIIDHSTTTEEAASHKGGKSGKGGDLLYRWGNPWSYKSGTTADRKLFDQHDVRWIPPGHPGAGHLMAFNNGPGRKYSSIIEIQAPLNSDGEYVLKDDGTYGPDELVWEYTADPPTDFFAGHISGATRLPNGNTLICNGESGRFFEVNSTNKTLWEFTQPYGGELSRDGRLNDPVELARQTLEENENDRRNEGTALFRAIKYAPDFPPFLGNSLQPLDPQPVPFATLVDAELEQLKSEQRTASQSGEVTGMREVSFATSDGGRVFASLYGDGDHAIVLAHGAAFNKESWTEQSELLMEKGFRVLAIDFRGYGKSQAGSQENALHLDVLSAVRYLRDQGAKQVSVIGGSMGGKAAAHASAESKPGEIDLLVLLAHSPIRQPKDLKGDKLFIVSDGDRLSQSVTQQYEAAPEPKKLVVLGGDAHAQHIFRTEHADELTTIIVDWLKSKKSKGS